MTQSVSRFFKSLCLTAFIFVALSGCKKTDYSIIQRVVVTPTEDFRFIRVALVFAPNIRSELAGNFTLKDYGGLFLTPFTADQPFQIGFDLDTSVFTDQDYTNLVPTMVLPNGLPTGIPYALVEVRSPTPISSRFDIYGYVDVLHTSWLGVAAIFGFINDQYFPAGLSINQVFLRDQQGRPGVMAGVFGPVVAANGTLQRNGGISVFANVRQLIQSQSGTREPISFYPEKQLQLNGPAAPEYQAHPKRLLKIQKNLVRGLNGQIH